MQEIGPHPPHHSVQPGALVLHDFMFHGLNPESVLRGEIDIVVMDFFLRNHKESIWTNSWTDSTIGNLQTGVIR